LPAALAQARQQESVPGADVEHAAGMDSGALELVDQIVEVARFARMEREVLAREVVR